MLIGARAHQDMPLPWILRDLGLSEQNSDRHPLFQVKFVFEYPESSRFAVRTDKQHVCVWSCYAAGSPSLCLWLRHGVDRGPQLYGLLVNWGSLTSWETRWYRGYSVECARVIIAI